jgi:predicted DNA-binding transcriptional regulator AlpA
MLSTSATPQVSEPDAPSGEPLPGGNLRRLMFRAEVLELLGVTNPTLWAWMRSGFFPRSVDIGSKRAWIASEVESWLARLPRSRLKGDTPLSEQPVLSEQPETHRERSPRHLCKRGGA